MKKSWAWVVPGLLLCSLVVALSCGKTGEVTPSQTPNPPVSQAAGPPNAPVAPPIPTQPIDGPDPVEPGIPCAFFSVPQSPEQIEQYKSIIREQLKNHQNLRRLFPVVFTAPDVFRALEIRPTDVIADIGAGTGGFEIALLEHGIPFQSLTAVDVDKASLDFLIDMVGMTGYDGAKKINIVQSTMTDVSLPPASIDLAVVFNVPIFNSELQPDGSLAVDKASRLCLETLFRSVKPGGRLYVLYTLDRDFDAPGRVNERLTHAYLGAGFQLLRTSVLSFPFSPQVKHVQMFFSKSEN